MTMPSKPENLSAAGKKPPHWLSPAPPLMGERALAARRDCPAMASPVGSPENSVSVLFGPSGSACAGVSLSTKYMPIALPPPYLR
jgi:hypothetical protein